MGAELPTLQVNLFVTNVTVERINSTQLVDMTNLVAKTLRVQNTTVLLASQTYVVVVAMIVAFRVPYDPNRYDVLLQKRLPQRHK